MKRYYYYIVAGESIDLQTKFYKVGIGTSCQDQRDYKTLTSIAQRRGYYFALVDSDSLEFVFRIALSLYPSYEVSPLDYLNIELVTARCLVKLLASSVTNSVDIKNVKARNYFQHYLNIFYRMPSERQRG